MRLNIWKYTVTFIFTSPKPKKKTTTKLTLYIPIEYQRNKFNRSVKCIQYMRMQTKIQNKKISTESIHGEERKKKPDFHSKFVDLHRFFTHTHFSWIFPIFHPQLFVWSVSLLRLLFLYVYVHIFSIRFISATLPFNGIFKCTLMFGMKICRTYRLQREQKKS